MATVKPRCSKVECFQNKCGVLCELLSSPPSYPCPFFKTVAEVEAGRVEAHKKLVEKGREDLIHMYEYNPQRRGQW